MCIRDSKFIKGIAEYEKMLPEVVATEELLREWVFKKQSARVIIGELDGVPVGFSLFFHNFSTFMGEPACTSRISLSGRNTEVRALARRSFCIWRSWPTKRAAAGWSGAASTGTSLLSIFTALWGPAPWTGGVPTG